MKQLMDNFTAAVCGQHAQYNATNIITTMLCQRQETNLQREQSVLLNHHFGTLSMFLILTD